MFYVFDLHIPRDEILKFYAGAARQVNATARCGTRVAFPAALLRRFVVADGVVGTFRLQVGAGNTLQSFERLSSA